jgi:hypothetical protein
MVFKAYMEHKAGEFFKTYVFVAREASDEDDEAAAAAVGPAAEAVATAAAAASYNTLCFSLD